MSVIINVIGKKGETIAKGILVGKNKKLKKGGGTVFNFNVLISIFALLLGTSAEAS